MNIPLIVAAVVIVAVSLFTARTSMPPAPPREETKKIQSPESLATKNAPSEKPTTPPIREGSKVDDFGWTYPGSVVLQEGDTLVLSSTDDADDITDWYKNKIESMGFNVRSFVKASANETIKNVIKAAGNTGNVSVEITKDPGDSASKITVSVSLE